MTNPEAINLAVAVLALGASAWAVALTLRVRQADSFAKLYDEYNSEEFGASLESIAEWVRSVASDLNKDPDALSEADVRLAYRAHLSPMLAAGKNTKHDPLERSRRAVKAWFVKCLLYHEGKDVSANHLRALTS